MEVGMVEKIGRFIVFCFLSFFLLYLVPLGKKAEEYQPCYKYELAFKFNFWEINSRLYYCKGKPLTFYYRQDFESGASEHFKTYKGELLMKFGGGILTLEGLGLNEIPLEENVMRRTPNDPFFETIKLKDNLGKEWTAIDLFPLASSFPEGCAGWIAIRNCKINGYEREIKIRFAVTGDKTHIKFSEVSLKPRVDEESVVGEFDYEAKEQWSPWVLISDLNSDGSDEIIVIQTYYRNQTMLVFSTTPKKFKGAKNVEKLLNSMGGDNNWPNGSSEVFKAGKITVIPFRNSDSFKKEQGESK